MKHHHLHLFLLVTTIFILLALIISNFYAESLSQNYPTKIGVSYSPEYAIQMGLDPKTTYVSILKDLNTKNIRLNAYWNEIEPTEGNFNFSDLDYYIEKSKEFDAKVYLAVGYKLPRWPECRAPKWLENAKTNLRQEKQLIFVKKVIERYEDNPTISAFQIENEPLLDFGECPKHDRDFLQKEVEFVRTLTKKPLILTDSGELRPWVTPMKLSDIFGTTLYRTVDAPILGQSNYPIQPWFYRTKSSLIRKFFAPNNKKTIIAELQTEAWANQPLTSLPIQTQVERFSIEDFKTTLQYSKRTGFDEIYLWGIEWWYYLSQNGHPEYLNYAKSIF